jgi:CarboxypepD_reg-like domain
MSDWVTVRHKVAIAGRVSDASTGKAVSNALVWITAMPGALEQRLTMLSRIYGNRWDTLQPRLDRTKSRQDGLFYFFDLPEGSYTITASNPDSGSRYGTVQQPAEVARDNKGEVKVAFIDLALQPTCVTGKITGPNHRTAIVLAEVRVKGSGERAFSDVQGQYVLRSIEPGQRTIEISAQGYKSKSEPVTIASPGTVETVNVSLARDT